MHIFIFLPFLQLVKAQIYYGTAVSEHNKPTPPPPTPECHNIPYQTISQTDTLIHIHTITHLQTYTSTVHELQQQEVTDVVHMTYSSSITNTLVLTNTNIIQSVTSVYVTDTVVNIYTEYEKEQETIVNTLWVTTVKEKLFTHCPTPVHVPVKSYSTQIHDKNPKPYGHKTVKEEPKTYKSHFKPPKNRIHKPVHPHQKHNVVQPPPKHFEAKHHQVEPPPKHYEAKHHHVEPPPKYEPEHQHVEHPPKYEPKKLHPVEHHDHKFTPIHHPYPKHHGPPVSPRTYFLTKPDPEAEPEPYHPAKYEEYEFPIHGDASSKFGPFKGFDSIHGPTFRGFDPFGKDLHI